MSDRELLRIALSAAVPLWIHRCKQQPWSAVDARREHALQMIAEHGDVILYRSKRKGETADAFNALAEGLAILSFVPGGVTAFDLHFEAEHPDLLRSS